MVAQQFSWDDQLQALNITEDGRANFAQIDDDDEAEAAEEEMKNLQFAFMVSTNPDTDEVCEAPCFS